MKNYSFGAKSPTINHDAALDQIRLAHRYRNDLCALELERRKKTDEAIRVKFPRLLALDALIAEHEVAVEKIYGDVKKGNTKARSRSILAEQKSAINEHREALRPLRAEHKELRKIAYEIPAKRMKAIRIEVESESSHRSIKMKISEVVEESLRLANLEGIDYGEYSHYVARKKARENCGVYWGTYLIVEKSCESFRKGAPPRFFRFDGGGSLGVQIQGGMLFSDLLDGADDTRLQLHRKVGVRATLKDGTQIMWGERHYDLWFRIGSGGVRKTDPIWCVIPITVDRIPPPATRIKEVAIHRRVIGAESFRDGKRSVHGGRVEWSVMFTCADCDEPSTQRGGIVGIDVGWRRFAGEGLRVAVAIGDDGQRHELRLSERDIEAVDKSRDIRGKRDVRFDGIRGEIMAWKQSGVELPEWFAERCKTLHLWKSPNALAALVQQWRDNRISGDDAIYSAAEAWRQRDGHLARYETGLRDGFIARRRVMYRQWVHSLASVYDVAAIEKMDLRELSESPSPDEKDSSSTKQRDNKRLANISLLRQFLKEKMEIVDVSPEYTTHDCHLCGHRNSFDSAVFLLHTCDNCGVQWDQDDNAAHNIRARGVAMKKERESLALIAEQEFSGDNPQPAKLSRKDRFAAARKRKSEALAGK